MSYSLADLQNYAGSAVPPSRVAYGNRLTTTAAPPFDGGPLSFPGFGRSGPGEKEE